MLRLLQYKMSGSEKGGHKESSSKLVPDEGRGQVRLSLPQIIFDLNEFSLIGNLPFFSEQWWHEASRALANIPEFVFLLLDSRLSSSRLLSLTLLLPFQQS